MTKQRWLAVVLFLGSAMFARAAGPDTLLGTWRVDLRPTPQAEPYFQAFVISWVDGERFSGTFYGAAFTDGIVNTAWGTTYFAFSTRDGQTAYHHAGKLDGDTLEGLTHAPGREFLAYWTATRTR